MSDMCGKMPELTRRRPVREMGAVVEAGGDSGGYYRSMTVTGSVPPPPFAAERTIDKFKERFAGHDGEYVLIGGGACDLLFGEAGQDFRATKDLDLVL